MTPQDIQPLIVAATPIAAAVVSSPVLVKVVDRIADYIGVRNQPAQTIQQAYADAEATLIKQSIDISLSDEKRLLARGQLAEFSRIKREQQNNESIVLKALPEVKEDAKPEEVEYDWYASFFDKSRLISDEQTQILWSKLLAGEINEPGTFSHRLVSLFSSLSKKEAQNFLSVCQYSCNDKGKPLVPIIYDIMDDFFKFSSLNFSILENLDSIGLIRHDTNGFIFPHSNQIQEINAGYFSTRFFIKPPENWNGEFRIGDVMFTDLGSQLARLCSPAHIDML